MEKLIFPNFSQLTIFNPGLIFLSIRQNISNLRHLSLSLFTSSIFQFWIKVSIPKENLQQIRI
jgi:hypothetical protein